MRTGNPPDELEVLVLFRVLRADYRVVLLRLDVASNLVDRCRLVECFPVRRAGIF